jgi:hypothetical protein
MEINMQPESRLTDSLLGVNELSYQMPPSLGIATQARHREEFAQINSYTVSSGGGGQTVVFDSQTGSSFVDPKASYYVFNISHNKPALDIGFGSGSIANIINTVTVRSRTGKEIGRYENFNLLCKYMDRVQESQEFLSSTLKAQGYSVNNVGTRYADQVPSTGKTYILRMCSIPCFSPVNSKLLPPQLMEGLRVEFRLEASVVAFCPNALASVIDNTLTYTLNRPSVQYKCYDLADAFARQIAMVASKSGLRLLHKEIFHTITSTASSQINFDIKKAASKALNCMAVLRDTANTTLPNVDCFAAKVNDILRYQANIGSVYWPNQPLTIPAVTDYYQSYYYSMYGAGKIYGGFPSSLTPEQWAGSFNANIENVVYNNNFIMINLNSSNVSDLVGMTVNNSRALLLDILRNTTDSVRLDSFLCHLRATTVFLSNVTVLD